MLSVLFTMGSTNGSNIHSIFHYLLGLDQEGIYRLSGMKSKIDELKASYDKGTASLHIILLYM